LIKQYGLPKADYSDIEQLLKCIYIRSGDNHTCVGIKKGPILFHTDRPLTFGLFDILKFLKYKRGVLQYYVDLYNAIVSQITCLGDCYCFNTGEKVFLIETDNLEEAIDLILEYFNFGRNGYVRVGAQGRHCCDKFVCR